MSLISRLSTALSRRAVLPFLLLLSSSADATTWYRVEVMLVAYQNEEMIDHELWADAMTAEPPQLALYQAYKQQQASYDWWFSGDSNYEEKMWAEFGFSDLPAASFPPPLTNLETLQLTEKAKRINYRDDMQVIWHQAWIEPIQEADKAIKHPIDVSLSDQLDIQLRGTIQLYVSRYLHFSSDLVIQHYQPENALNSLTLPASGQPQKDYRAQLSGTEMSDGELQRVPLRSGRVRQSRRMRSNELHYIDHPMLGAIVKVIPINSKDDLRP